MSIVYYRGPSAHITEDLLEVWTPEHRAFRIDDLDSVYVVCGARRGLAACLLAVAAILVAAALPVVAAPAAVLALAAVVAAASIALAACLRNSAPPYELRAVHRGEPVRLFRSADERVFGQVRRALMRAIQGQTT